MRVITFILGVILILTVVSAQENEEPTCSPWLGYCSVHGDCCRDLTCLGYNRKCVPIYGIKIPGQDTRPIGPPPYPPQQ
ncbi:hypothetical protein TKK_0019295 [Trichogramma kaykai]|uniref:Cysteine rich secreted protein n=1 Tax=Trichogramma kaykai TaxID=54128 RepID=A0ABD2VTE9_9HYME